MNNLPEVLENFLIYIRTIKGMSRKTEDSYELDLKLFFKFMKKHLGLSDEDIDDIDISHINLNFIKRITLEDLIAFMTYCGEDRSNGSASKARKTAALKTFFKYLHETLECIEHNPTLKLESPKIGKKQPVYLTLEQSKKLISSIKGRNIERDRCILTLLLNCGLRLSELCSIDMNDIKKDTLTITGKGNKQRVIYLNKACLKALKAYYPKRHSYINENYSPLFFSESRKPDNRIGPKTVQRIVERCLKAAGIKGDNISPHKLRHTCATLMYGNGVDLRSLQMLLGHNSISTTEIYTHLDDETLRNAVNINPLSDL